MRLRTLIVGLGNPILSDDGVGWRIECALRQQLSDDPSPAVDLQTVDFLHICTGGLALAELMIGYDRVIVADAIVTGQASPGTVYHFRLADLPGTLNSSNSHDTSLRLGLQMLRSCGAHVPREGDVDFIAVEAQDVWTFGESCTPAVEQGIPAAVTAVTELLAAPRQSGSGGRIDNGLQRGKR